MGLIHPDNWIWDFWFAVDPPNYHIFYLQAPRSLEDEQLRHFHASIGHAVSTDLLNWQILPDALQPDTNEPDAWDNYVTWTGSILQHNGIWFMFYTGCSQSEEGLIQRIGLATSSDLIHWQRYGSNPVLELDPRWYERLDLSAWHDQAWRDPWVYWNPVNQHFHMLLTARINHGPPDGRGVIGHAASHDLLHWETLPPLTEPGFFGHMEVPQLLQHGRFRHLLFSAPSTCFSKRALDTGSIPPQTGTFYLTAAHDEHSFDIHSARALLADRTGSWYSARAVQTFNGNWHLMAALIFTQQQSFVGSISDPYPVVFHNDGTLKVDTGPGPRTCT